MVMKPDECTTGVFNPRTCKCLKEYPVCTEDICPNGRGRDQYDCGCYDEDAPDKETCNEARVFDIFNIPPKKDLASGLVAGLQAGLACATMVAML